MNDAEKGGKENTAFDNESDSKKDQQQQQQQNGTTAGTSGKEDEKWVQNYVPFGDYPKGNIVYVKEVIIKPLNTLFQKSNFCHKNLKKNFLH